MEIIIIAKTKLLRYELFFYSFLYNIVNNQLYLHQR